MGDGSIDKSQRSVFVGNIPYEATEERLKEIFSEVGPVISFKLVYDRETGKPKGYGFCEYADVETALSAMRNLNGVEIGGRTLRVDNACTEKNRMEMQMMSAGRGGGGGGMQAGLPDVMGGGQEQQGPYGESVDPDRAPEVIAKTVASLPPEQMFELMKQMKTCLQENPQEARTMLVQNPQLAYALLQAQVVMRQVL
jgi:cleavage stimulation factor subunit 2